TKRGSMKGHDDRLRRVFNLLQEIMEIGSTRTAAMGVVLQLFDVSACNKRFSGADNDNGSNGRIPLRLVEGSRDSFRHSRRKRVDGRIVDCYYSHTARYRYSNQFSHVCPNPQCVQTNVFST